MKSALGSQYNIPYNYFQNLYVRKAFAYSFNYSNFINKILGNQIYGGNFGFHYTGMIIKGLPGYLPSNQLQNVPYYNLSLAKKYMIESGLYNLSVNFPIVIYGGDTIDYTAAQMWAQNLSAVDPNIHATPMYLPIYTVSGFLAPNVNPMPISMGFWAPDYPYPYDYIYNLYTSNGYFPIGDGWNTSNLLSSGYTQEAAEFQEMVNLINLGHNTINYTLAIKDFQMAQQIAINLTLYVYTDQLNEIWIYAPWIEGVQYEENPMIGGMGDTLYYYLIK
jgi:ABC-type oligopeptide transport system substrate-binding subunit